MRRAGIDESVAQKISRHKTNHVFKRYNIVNTADVEQAMERMNTFYETEDATIEQPAVRVN